MMVQGTAQHRLTSIWKILRRDNSSLLSELGQEGTRHKSSSLQSSFNCTQSWTEAVGLCGWEIGPRWAAWVGFSSSSCTETAQWSWMLPPLFPHG